MVEPRSAKPTVKFCDEYCQCINRYLQKLEALKRSLHLGLLSESNAKRYPRLPRIRHAQSLHHLTESPWRTEDFRQQRLQLILPQSLDAPEIVLVIDDTGDRKKGHHTDHVKRQYIGNWVRLRMALLPSQPTLDFVAAP